MSFSGFQSVRFALVILVFLILGFALYGTSAQHGAADRIVMRDGETLSGDLNSVNDKTVKFQGKFYESHRCRSASNSVARYSGWESNSFRIRWRVTTTPAEMLCRGRRFALTPRYYRSRLRREIDTGPAHAVGTIFVRADAELAGIFF